MAGDTRLAAGLLLLVALTACTGSSSDPSVPSGPTSSTSSTSTTEPPEGCEEVTSDAVDYLVDVADVLDEITVEVFREPALWPTDLVELQAEGRSLDERSEALGCSSAAIQAEALAELEERDYESSVVELLVVMLTPQTG